MSDFKPRLDLRACVNAGRSAAATARPHLNELKLATVLEGRVHLRVARHRVVGVDDVNTEMAEQRAEKVVLGAVLEQRTLQRGACHLVTERTSCRNR